MATHFSILAWKTPWAEEPGGLQPMESQRVRHDRVTLPTTANSDLKLKLKKLPPQPLLLSLTLASE